MPAACAFRSPFSSFILVFSFAGYSYKGRYKNQDVAIKLFSKGTVSNSQDFKRELAMLSLIRHPLVITCNGGSSKPGDEFIVEELMEASVYDLLHDESFEMGTPCRRLAFVCFSHFAC